MSILRLTISLVIIFTFACTSSGRNFSKKIKIPEKWFEQDGTTVKKSIDLSSWWIKLGDPILNDLISKAVSENRDIAITISRIREIAAKHRIASSASLPEVSTSGTVSQTATKNDSYLKVNAGPIVSWELDLFGRIENLEKAAKLDLESAKALMHATKVSIVSEIGLLYIELRSLQSRLKNTLQNIKLQQDSLILAEFKEKAGLGGSLDVIQARSNIQATESTVPTLKTSINETIHGLELLLGTLPGTLKQKLSSPRETPQMPDEITTLIPVQVLKQRPDIISADKVLNAQYARVEAAKAALYPKLILSGNFSIENVMPGVGPGFLLSIISGLTAPLYNGGKLRSEVKVQEEQLRQAWLNYINIVHKAFFEVENALISIKYLRVQVKSLEKAIDFSTQGLSLARQKYTSGMSDYSNVIDILRSLLTQKENLIITKANQLKALVKLYKSMGGGW